MNHSNAFQIHANNELEKDKCWKGSTQISDGKIWITKMFLIFYTANNQEIKKNAYKIKITFWDSFINKEKIAKVWQNKT